MANRRIAFAYGVPFGQGGLAVQSANAAAALAGVSTLHAIGPTAHFWPRSDPQPELLHHDARTRGPWWSRWPIARAYRGRAQFAHDVTLGRCVADSLDSIDPSLYYSFTQVGLEGLRWCRRRGVPTVLESPNGHIRAFRQVYLDEYARWCGSSYHGHPTQAMVDRVVEEYAVADRIRVSSQWAKASLVAHGVPPAKISVLQQPVDLTLFHPPLARAAPEGPLRVVCVATLDLRKGFIYLLDAIRRLKGGVSVELVGGTVDRCTSRLLSDRLPGLDVRVCPGDPRDAYHHAELSVLPTLEDGSPFAAAEAMAAGLPVIVTTACGASEWVDAGRTGWIVPDRNADAIADALTDARRRRGELNDMGRAARLSTERRASSHICDRAVAEWTIATGGPS